MKGVFDAKANSGYDDDIARRYHFPPRYLADALACLNDWIVYREPQRNGGSKAYIAVARVTAVAPDPAKAGYHYASVTDFLRFDRPVPLKNEGRYEEAPLRALENQLLAGRYLQGKSIRPLADGDFAAIVRAGLSETLSPDNAIRLGLTLPEVDAATADLLSAPPAEQQRRIVQMLVNRKIRDANFRRQVCDAYADRCAVTGLRIVNGGGKSEAQAAHIWPVLAGGPDTVQNGIALSATAHWLFDRHLISLSDDYGLLVSHNRVPAELRSLFDRQLERVHLPQDVRLWPNPSYVRRHRELFASQ